jgi:hypothetical protein
MPRLITTLAAVAVALLPVPARTQTVASAGAPLPAGTRIRVTVATSLDAVTGVVLSHRADTLAVSREAAGDTIAVPVGQVIRLDVSEGTRTFRRQGAKIGLAGGLAIGAIAGAAAYRDPGCGGEGAMFCIDLGPGLDIVLGAMIGGAAGALVGVLVGSHPTEVWKRTDVSLAGRPRLGIVPSSRGGVALTASLPF